MAESKDEQSRKPLTLAIVGGGPTGLSALESVYAIAAERLADRPIKTTLFEPTEFLGCGPNHDPGQSSVNWLNLSERALALEDRRPIALPGLEIAAFPSYHSWADVPDYSEDDDRTDEFAPRPKLGQYLRERFESIAHPLRRAGWLEIVAEKVTDLRRSDGSFVLCCGASNRLSADEVVLTIGHQSTSDSATFCSWKKHAESTDACRLIAEPYPTRRLTVEDVISPSSVVAIRGMGLAMIDIVKALTEDRGGRFESLGDQAETLRYQASGREPALIIPFSLDGLAPAPKPLNARIDNLFRPSPEQIVAFRTILELLAAGKTPDGAREMLIDSVASLHADLFWKLPKRLTADASDPEEISQLGKRWLEDATFQHPLLTDPHRSPAASLRSFIAMATDTAPMSLDYSLGQVWRHLQPTLYAGLSHSTLPPEDLAEITELDERMKRYAFGPPVASLQRLLALTEANILSFRVVDDPDVECVEGGWRFVDDDESMMASIMIDSVLAGPKLVAVLAPLIVSLRERGWVTPIHEDLGARTRTDGVVIDHEGNSPFPLALLGRLAKGTLLGTDAILECFGGRQDLWARGLVARAAGRETANRRATP